MRTSLKRADSLAARRARRAADSPTGFPHAGSSTGFAGFLHAGSLTGFTRFPRFTRFAPSRVVATHRCYPLPIDSSTVSERLLRSLFKPRVAVGGTSPAMASCVAHKVEELDTWKLCNELVARVEAATERAPASKDRKFCEQINDAAADALSDMAEGFARFYPNDHAAFLGYAIASLEEVRTRAGVGYQRKYFDEKTTSDLINLCYRTERAAKNLRAYLWTVKREDLPPRPDILTDRRRRARRNERRRGRTP